MEILKTSKQENLQVTEPNDSATSKPKIIELESSVAQISIENNNTSIPECRKEFKFFECDKSGFTYLNSSEFNQSFTKWGLHAGSVIKSFRFEPRFEPEFGTENEEANRFILAFFNNDNVQASFATEKLNRGEFSEAISTPSGTFSSVQFQHLSATMTNVKVFDKLEQEGLVTKSGAIRKCFEEQYDGATSYNLITEMFLNEDSEYSVALSENEKREFLTHILHRLAVGGSVCQNDETIQPYKDATRSLYKDLVTVYRDENSSDINVGSHVYQVTALDNSHIGLFLRDNPNNFCYLIVDPLNKRVHVWMYSFLPFW